MKQHIKSVHHNKDKTLHKCDFCGEWFSGIRKLETHVDKIHRLVKDFHCDICGNEFVYENDLKQHIKRIHKEKILQFD